LSGPASLRAAIEAAASSRVGRTTGGGRGASVLGVGGKGGVARWGGAVAEPTGEGLQPDHGPQPGEHPRPRLFPARNAAAPLPLGRRLCRRLGRRAALAAAWRGGAAAGRAAAAPAAADARAAAALSPAAAAAAVSAAPAAAPTPAAATPSSSSSPAARRARARQLAARQAQQRPARAVEQAELDLARNHVAAGGALQLEAARVGGGMHRADSVQ
jgi:hypothetical protein